MPRNVAKGVRNRGVRQFSEICFSAEGIHVALLTHPHFVRVSALRATTGPLKPDQFPFAKPTMTAQLPSCAVAVEDITLLSSKMIRAYYTLVVHFQDTSGR